MERATRRRSGMRRGALACLSVAVLLWPSQASAATAISVRRPATPPAIVADASSVHGDAGPAAQPLDAGTVDIDLQDEPAQAAASVAALVGSDQADDVPPADPGPGHQHPVPNGAVKFRPASAAEQHATGLVAAPGLCDGGFLSEPGTLQGPARAAAVGGIACTHGGDYVGATPPEVAPALYPGYSSPGIPCYSTGPYVHVFYGYRAGSSNRIATVGPRILETVSRIDDIFATAAAKDGAIRHVRWLMSSCKLVISAVALPASVIDQENPGPIRSYLISQGLMSTAQKALMFTDDGETGCSGIAGIAEWNNDERTTSSNRNNQGAMLARVFGWCWSPVGYIDVASEVGAHELSHTLGAVGNTAPNSSYRTGGQSHCTDGVDLMCYDDGGGEPRAVCPDAYPPTLDCNQDDYFNPSPPAGSYLASHWNIAQNQFLATASPGSFQVPPRPKATLTSPSSSVVAGVVNASATAVAASDGAAVVQVEFWLGNDIVGTDSGPPYASQFDTMLDGLNGYPNGAVLKLVAVAVDAQGRTGPSAPVTVTIGNPKVRLTAPVAWARQAGTTVSWSASASAYTGRSVSNVQLLEGGSVLATDTTAPYGGSVALSPGTHALQARVTDSGGVSRDSVARAVFIGPTGPAVTLVAPAPYEYFSAATNRVQHLAATAVARPGRTISSVTFTANGIQVGNPDTAAPYEVSWTPTIAGPYEIVAHATDSASGTGDSDPATIDVVEAPVEETVAITSPANDAHVSATVDVNVSVSLPSNWVINSLDIEIDGSVVGSASGSGTVPIDLTGYLGQHVLRAVLDAYDQGTFEEVTLGSAGTTIVLPGAIAITAPAAGATLTGTVTVTGAVTGVSPSYAAPLSGFLAGEFYVAYLDEPGFSSTFDSTEFEDGSTTLTVESVSVYGLSSPAISVTLKNAGASMTAPTSGATISGRTTISVKATADGGVPVEQVRFFVDGVDKGGDWTAPYQFSWNPAGLADGSHTLRADAILGDGRTLSTGNRAVTLKTVTPPTGTVTRLAGSDRYATAVAITQGLVPNPRRTGGLHRQRGRLPRRARRCTGGRP